MHPLLCYIFFPFYCSSLVFAFAVSPLLLVLPRSVVPVVAGVHAALLLLLLLMLSSSGRIRPGVGGDRDWTKKTSRDERRGEKRREAPSSPCPSALPSPPPPPSPSPVDQNNRYNSSFFFSPAAQLNSSLQPPLLL